MVIEFQQSNSDNIHSHLPEQVTYFNSGNNRNGSGVQYNGEINIDYNKLHHMYCSCENWKFTPDEVKLEYADMEEVGKSISEVVNNIVMKNSGRQFFCFNTGNNINKSGTQTSGGINFNFMEVYNFHYGCQNLKHRLDEAEFEFTDIEAVRQIPEAENIILLKKSGMSGGKQIFSFNTGNNHNESGMLKSGGINFCFKQVYNTYYSYQNSKETPGEAKFDIRAEEWIPEEKNVMLEGMAGMSGGLHFISFDTGNNYNVSGTQISGSINFRFKQGGCYTEWDSWYLDKLNSGAGESTPTKSLQFDILDSQPKARHLAISEPLVCSQCSIDGYCL